MNLDNYRLNSQPGDMVAVMVGDECRGIQTIEETVTTSSNVPLTAFGRQENEEARILYYSSLENAVYDLGTTIQLKAVTRVVIIQ